MRTTRRVLVYAAAAVWYIGGIVLFKSGYELIEQARDLRPGELWPWALVGLGLVLGVIQSATIFTRSCRRNIQRISRLEDPRLWQFFRPGFFAALAVMIASGILLDHLSQGKYFFMLAVAALDFALTISLLGSSYVFWTEDLPD